MQIRWNKKRLIIGMILFVVFFLFPNNSVKSSTSNVTVSSTITAICGNGDVDTGEGCDGANLNSKTCVTEGFSSGSLACSASCTLVTTACSSGGTITPPPSPVCGNGAVETGEQCDAGAGNGVACTPSYGSSCSYCSGCSTVTVSGGSCGDGTVNGTEQCDAGASNGTACSASYGGSCSYCSGSCGNLVVTGARCGDSIVNGTEQCDDGNGAAGDGCSPGCQTEVPEIAVCGNGNVEGSEQCDAGAGNGNTCSASYGGTCSYCLSNCHNQTISGGSCGDGSVNGGEQCDDGNRSAGDGCSPGCVNEAGGTDVTPPGGGGETGGGETGGGSGTGGGSSGGGGIINDIVTQPVEDAVNFVNNAVGIISQNEFVREQTQAVGEAVTQVAESVQKQFNATTQQVGQAAVFVNEVANNPTVEQVTEQVVAPTMVITSAAMIMPSLWSILLPFLRFLFLQPLLVVGRRKKEGWGVVYNSLNKMPVDLATVRLLDVKTNKLVQSRVTDRDGRYIFLVEPGEYILQASKAGFVFPSNLLKSVLSDGRFPDLYHGEKITVTTGGVNITPNIPCDPIGEIKPIKRIFWEKNLRVLQHIVSFVGVIATAVAFYITPVWYVGVFLVIHLVIYGLFVKYVQPKKHKGWGIVYDKSNKKPVGKAVARLFSKEFNRLVSTQLTSSNGSYAFLAGPSDYFVTFEKEGYQTGKSSDILLKEKKDLIVKEDVGLEKAKTDLTDLKTDQTDDGLDPPSLARATADKAADKII